MALHCYVNKGIDANDKSFAVKITNLQPCPMNGFAADVIGMHLPSALVLVFYYIYMAYRCFKAEKWGIFLISVKSFSKHLLDYFSTNR